MAGESFPGVSTQLNPLTVQWKEKEVEKYAVLAMALLVSGYAIAWALFLPPYLGIDDLGLMNPVYVYVHTGNLAYPSYGFFNSMFVHPPTHYLVLAWLIKLGIPASYVASIPPLFFILLSVLFIAKSPFSAELKVALLFGFLAGVLFPWWYTGPISFSLRPDAHVAFAWFAGLLALENGRLRSWNWAWLGTGAFLLTYASGLHYPTGVAWLGTLLYMAWVLRERGWRQALVPVAAMTLGGCAFGVPFLLGFLIPHWQEISNFLKSASPMGGVIASVREHVAIYELAQFPQGWIAKIFYFPFLAGVPLVFIAFPVLLSKKHTRGIALAAMPLVLFVVLFVQRKFDTKYLFPEFLIYGCAMAVALMLVVSALIRRFAAGQTWVTIPLLTVLFSGILVVGAAELGSRRALFHLRLDHMALARAAGRQILGSGALVGARISRFYTNGGDLSYMLEPDVLWANISDRNLLEYFEKFDAVAEDSFSSDVTANERKESLSSWYASGTLQVRGFYFSYLSPVLSYLLLHPRVSQPLTGYATLPSQQIVQFQQRENGGHVFVAVVCLRNQLSRAELPMLVDNTLLLPLQPGTSPHEIVTFVAKRQDYATVRASISAKCKIRDEVPVHMELMAPRQLLATLRDDPVIRFFPTYEEAVDARWGPHMHIETSVSGWPEKFELRRGAREGEAYSLTGKEVQVLARSDMEEDAPLKQAQYGKQEPPSLVSHGMANGDHALSFRPQTLQDHLFTEFSATAEGGLVFFSLWAQAEGRELPLISIQDDGFNSLAHARHVAARSDGWVLLAGWVEISKSGRIRLVVVPKGDAFRFDKLMLLQLPSERLAKKRGKSVR